jgi:hypothetical protein
MPWATAPANHWLHHWRRRRRRRRRKMMMRRQLNGSIR